MYKIYCSNLNLLLLLLEFQNMLFRFPSFVFSVFFILSCIHTEIISSNRDQMSALNASSTLPTKQNLQITPSSRTDEQIYSNFNVLSRRESSSNAFYQYMNICQNGFIYNSLTNRCQYYQQPSRSPVLCSKNQILVNGKCTCDDNSVYSNGNCIVCIYSTFKDPKDGYCRLCSNVMPYCQHCQSSNKCITCAQNMQIDQKGSCICPLPYYMIRGFCMKCMDGQEYNNKTNNCEVIVKHNQRSISYHSKTQCIRCKENQQEKQGFCTCNNLTVNYSGTCQPCPPRFYKYATSCFQCPTNCKKCNNFMDCVECQAGYAFNSFYFSCQPECKINQIKFINECICDSKSGRNEQGACQICPLGTIKYNDRCQKCGQNCKVCYSNTMCSHCQDGYALNWRTLTCCKQKQAYNSILQICQCKYGYYNISGTCGKCAQGLIYNEANQKCTSGPLHWCGDLYLDNGEECDDGNNKSGDGCSSQCKLQNGYLCSLSDCRKMIAKISSSMGLSGFISMGFRYLMPQLYKYTTLIEVNVTRGTPPKSIQIINPKTDPMLIIVLLNYQKDELKQDFTLCLKITCQFGKIKFLTDFKVPKKEQKNIQ